MEQVEGSKYLPKIGLCNNTQFTPRLRRLVACSLRDALLANEACSDVAAIDRGLTMSPGVNRKGVTHFFLMGE